MLYVLPFNSVIPSTPVILICCVARKRVSGSQYTRICFCSTCNSCSYIGWGKCFICSSFMVNPSCTVSPSKEVFISMPDLLLSRGLLPFASLYLLVLVLNSYFWACIKHCRVDQRIIKHVLIRDYFYRSWILKVVVRCGVILAKKY